MIADIKASGAVSLRAVAAELNTHGILTRRGGQWQVSHVRNLLARLDELLSANPQSGTLMDPSPY